MPPGGLRASQRHSDRRGAQLAYPLRQVLDAATRDIRQDQSIIDCDNKHCLRCRDSIAGGRRINTPDDRHRHR